MRPVAYFGGWPDFSKLRLHHRTLYLALAAIIWFALSAIGAWATWWLWSVR